jgi:hypothetical protein
VEEQLVGQYSEITTPKYQAVNQGDQAREKTLDAARVTKE